jgi:hypothetical protein
VWRDELVTAGVLPEMKLLEVTTTVNASEREGYWIGRCPKSLNVMPPFTVRRKLNGGGLVKVTLDEDQRKILEALSEATLAPVSALIRDAVSKYLESRKNELRRGA